MVTIEAERAWDIRGPLPITWNPDWAERFDRYVVFAEDHWYWIGYVDPDDGYGRLRVDGKLRRVHRLAYARWVGPLDEDDDRLIVDHRCRVRTCIKPEHLKLVTYQENLLNSDGPSATNARKTACDRGHPFDTANTYPMPGGGRACRTCRREWMRSYRATKARGSSPEAPSTPRPPRRARSLPAAPTPATALVASG